MHLLTMLVVTSAALGRELTWPGDCELTRVADGWMRLTVQQPLLLGFNLITDNSLLKISIISEESGDEHIFNQIYNGSSDCENIRYFRRENNCREWKEIFVITPFNSSSKLVMISHHPHPRTNYRIVGEVRPPVYINLTMTGEGYVLSNCPNVGCQKDNQKFITPSASKIFSFFIRPRDGFDGVEIITRDGGQIKLDPSHFNKSLWNLVYIANVDFELRAWVNGRMMVESIRSRDTDIKVFRVLGEYELKWCKPEVPLNGTEVPLNGTEVPLNDTEVHLVWYVCLAVAVLLFLELLVLAACCVFVRRKKLAIANDLRTGISTAVQLRTMVLDGASTPRSDGPNGESPLATEPIYESLDD